MNDTVLVCPRCGGQMSTYARVGVQVDQCQNCKGIFLDRGELEQLVQAEQSYNTPPAAAPAPPPYPPQGYQQPGYQQPGYGYGHDEHHGGGHGYRRRGLLHDLFED